MASKRLSFRLQEESEEIATWEKLKKKHPNKKDQQIFNELLRREAIRIDNKETHSDILRRVEEKVEDVGMIREVREGIRLLIQHVSAGGSNDS